MRWLHFILSHSFFIAVCAVALCYQTYALLHLKANEYVYGFIFFATLCSYNFYWLVSKYSFSQRGGISLFIKQNLSYLLIFCVAAIGMIWSVIFIQQVGFWIIVAILLTLIYSMPLWPFEFAKELRRLGFLKTFLLAFTWSFVTVVIPAMAEGNQQTLPVCILLTARFFFMLMLCAIFDMRDVKMDKIHSLRSLATDVNRKTFRVIMFLSFVFYMLAGLMVRFHFGDDLQLTVFILTGLIVWYVYRLSLKEQGYIFYYFIVDGLMILSASATFIAQMIKNG